MRTKRIACGFVLTRATRSGVKYLLLTNRKRKEPGLPKGHAESGESELATALRETEEETGLTDLEVNTDFRRKLYYPAQRNGQSYDKIVVYFLARTRTKRVTLSKEHSHHKWASLEQALYALPYPSLRRTIRKAALYIKDPALFELQSMSEEEADGYLIGLPEATPNLIAHLRGGARLARRFAEALEAKGVAIDVEATATGTLLHDVGRAIGKHDDHQRAGLKLLRKTPFAAYGFACISHFTKGASAKALVKAGVPKKTVRSFRRLIDIRTLTWEERCAALADACMKGPEAVAPVERFRDLRSRYDAPALIDLQERRTEKIRARMAKALGRDPLELVGIEV